MKMKLTSFAVAAGLAVAALGCRSTVDDSHTFASTWGKDTVVGSYNRTVDQVYHAAVVVIQTDGTLIAEYIPHDNTNAVRALQGKVGDTKVWMRVSAVDNKTTQVEVQSRGKWGGSDIALSHQLEKEIALQLVRQAGATP